MSKLRYLWCGVLILLLVCGLAFGGCGNNINNLSIKLTSASLVESEKEGEYDLTLIKTTGDDDPEWSAEVSAEVLGLSGGMSSKIGWHSDSRFVVVTPSADGTSAVLTGVTSTSAPTVVTAYSIENRKAEARINVTNIVVPQRITSSKYADKELGIPLNTPFSLDAGSLFEFYPSDATVPEYQFSIGGTTVNSQEPFVLSSLPEGGYTSLIAEPLNKSDYTTEQLQALSYTIDLVRVYTPLTGENTKLTVVGDTKDVTEVTLIKNSKNKNKAVLKVDAPSSIEYTISSENNIVFDEETNKKGELSIAYDSRLKQFTLVGLETLNDFCNVNIHFTVAGVKNSLVLTKTFKVQIVDYPTAILVNGVAGSNDMRLRVFDRYAAGEQGTAMRLNISPDSKLFTEISIGLDPEKGVETALIRSLLINGQPFTGSVAKIKSGTTLYLTNSKGYGEFDILVYAADTRGTEDEVVRRITISLEQSVSEMTVSGDVLDEKTGYLMLEVDEYNSPSVINYRDLTVDIQPATASFDTVKVISNNDSIATASVKSVGDCQILVQAKQIGTTSITLLADSGVKVDIPVRVVARYKSVAISLDPNMNTVMYAQDLTTTKPAAGLDNVQTLDKAYIAKTGSGDGVYLMNEFYPRSAVTSGVVESIEFTSSDARLAYVYNTNSDIYKNVLTTEQSGGVVTFDITVRYYRLEGSSLVLQTQEIQNAFTIEVFERISSLNVNESSVELLAAVQTFGIGSASKIESVYDSASNSKKLRVTVNPNNSYITAEQAIWSVEGNTSKITLSTTSGGETVVSVSPLAGNSVRVSATVVVSLTDLNGVTFTQEVKIIATKIQQITDVYINNYENSLKNNSLYFEMYKNDSFTLDVTVAPSNATNKKLEYIIYDAELLSGYQSGSDVIRVYAGNNKYQYYKVKHRTGSDYETQYQSQTADLIYNEADDTYTIKPKKAGYAFVFIIPQDVANTRVDTINGGLTDQLRNVTDRSTIKRIPITVADGEKVYYQLYTAEDVASISSTDDGLTKNYYLMNTIDMSAYINKQLNKDRSWQWKPIGSIDKPFTGSVQSMVFNGESPTQSIVGWTLSRTLNNIEVNSSVDYRNYGIWGVVTGKISNINIYINKFDMRQGVFMEHGNAVYNNYNYGLVAGRLGSREIRSEESESVMMQYGEISGVTVYCANLAYTYNFDPQHPNTRVSANLGVVGMADSGTKIDGVNVSIYSAKVVSDDMIVNFGGIVGKNYGMIGNAVQNNSYTNTSAVTAEMLITYRSNTSTNSKAQSTLGGAVGLNMGEVKSTSVSGELSANTKITIIGGAIGQNIRDNDNVYDSNSTILQNSAYLTNILSATRIRTTAADAIQGGVVGTSDGGQISFAYYDIYTTQKGDASDSLGISSAGYTGGIAGKIKDTILTYCIVQAYDLETEVVNILGTDTTTVIGGLVGYADGGSISHSFVNAGLKITSGVVGGILGETKQDATTKTQISDVYARGYLRVVGMAGSGYAFVGRFANNVSISDAYADFGDDTLDAFYDKSGEISNIYLVRSTESSLLLDSIKIINRDLLLDKCIPELSFNSSSWAIDKGTTPTNDGFPYLKYNGEPFIRLVPKTVAVDAIDHDAIVDDKINTVLNVGTDTKKLILAYREDAIYSLSDLFALSTDLNIAPENIGINYTLNNTSVIQMMLTTNFVTTQFKIIGTGTVCIRVSSSQNHKAYDVVQICVVESFDSVDILDENRNSIIQAHEAGDYTTLKIKHNGSTQVFAEYSFDGQKVNSTAGGVKFVTGLKYDTATNSLQTVTDTEGNILTNYNISIQSWQEGEYGELDALYYYLSGNDKIALVSVGDDRDNRFVTIIIPYIKVQFYDLDEDKNITTLKSYNYEISEIGELSFETQIYYGVTDIVMGVGDGTQIQSGEKLRSSVTIFNDAYVDSMGLDDMLYYQLYKVCDDESEELVAYSDPTLVPAESVLGSSEIFVDFTDITYYAKSNAVVISYTVELSQTMRKTLKNNQAYRIVIGAIDDNGEKIDKTVSLKWTFIPQDVNHIKIEHYSDAINNGAKLTQAGDTPTNTIVAGEYGLLKISLSPDYAYFDSITVTSSEVAGSPMVFDQRVLDVSIDRTSGEEIYNYLTWQQGVGVIQNGLSLRRVSLVNGDFDGNFYVRTICLRTLPTGTKFTITVTITQNEQEHSFSEIFTVYKTDTLSVEGEHYSDILGHYIVAEGTGYVSEDTWEQNRNPLTIKIGDAYFDTEISVDTASKGQGASVVRANGKYYLYTGQVAKNNLISVTLTAKQDIGGFTYRATRTITFEVVDFYISTLRDDVVMPTTKRYAFIDEKLYEFNLFAGIDATNIKELSVVTFDPSNLDTCRKVLQTIQSLNGIGATPYNGWFRRTVEPDGRIAFVSVQPKTEADEVWIDNNYQFLITANGYKVLSSGLSTGNILRYEMLFYYDGGEFVLTSSQSNATFGLSTDNINLEFYQVTSQEHPQPIRTLNQFMSMQSDIDYILLNDLNITGAWTPLNVAVKSFNGNGYKINFDATSITPSGDDTNYGLFGTIDAKSVIKNVKIVLNADGLAINDNEASETKLNFGVLAGTNKGTVYNCEVYGLNNKQPATLMSANPTSTDATHNIAGLVAINAGGISNSRVQYVSLRAGGNVAGLVVENSGTIAGTYYTGGTITNLSESANYATAGFVINNTYEGKITSSFVGGTYTVTDAEGNSSLDTRGAVAKTRDATIQSGVTSAGFVYDNYGKIADCYSAVEIFSTNMSGFAFSNYASGTIARCFSTSDLSSTGSIILSYPFIGVAGDNATDNNNKNKANGITNCYYYDSGFTDPRLEEAKELSAEDLCGKNGTTAFSDFIFSRDGEAGSEFTGVWTFVSKDNLYFTPDRFYSELAVAADPSIDKLYTNFGPKLVSASLIATPRMDLIKSEENEVGEIVHTYSVKYPSVFTKADNADYLTDYCYDPILVSNMSQFSSAFDATNETLAIKGEGSGAIILSDIRVVKSLNQSELNSGETLYSPSANYAGILSGNGFALDGVSLAVNSQDIETYGLIGRLSRVPATADDTINYIGTIKNYSVSVTNIACATVTYVGGLVGWVDSGNLYDIEVTNREGRVVGNNVVGGIAGYVTGTSMVHTAYSNVGVTANYRASTEKIYNHDLIRAYSLDSDRKVNIDLIGYAGGLFGIVDLTMFDSINPSSSDTFEARVYNISNDSTASVVGKIAGGLIGGVGEYSVIYKAKKTVVSGALVKGYVFSGGIAGQNNGFIKYANVEYDTDVQAAVDKTNTGAAAKDAHLDYFNAGTSPLAIGGIVGLNIGSSNISWPGGTIQLSSCKIAVRDSTAGNAGGIAGAVYGGDLRACLATGSVLASNRAFVGGIVGYLSDFSADNAILIGMDNPFGEATSCGTTLDYLVAMNNYLASDYNYYYTLYTNDAKGINGAIGGIVGYVLDRSLIYTTHTIATSTSDPYAYLTHPSNYFVSQISNRIIPITQTTPITSGSGYFNLYEENDEGEMIVNLAIGKYGSNKTINLAQGKTRGFMLQHPEIIFDGWDKFSLDYSNGTPSITEKDLPDLIEVSTIEDLNIMYWHPERDYVLVADIDFQDYSAPEGEKRILTPFYAIGSESAPFTGSFTSRAKSDGSLPVIKDIYIINSDATSLGFFGAISNAEISNIILQNIHYNTALHKNVKAWVGGLAGIVTNSVVQNVSILNTDTANSGIYTNANVVGGMFGMIRSLHEGKTVIEGCYVENNLVLDDNIYTASLQTGAVQAYYGGFAGQIMGDSSIANSMAIGALTINYSDSSSPELYAENAGEIEHIVGGFAGQISGEKVTESACVSGVNITLNNVLSHTRAGGFAGIIGGTRLTKVDSHSNININFADIPTSKVLYVGGLVGDQSNASTISGFVSAGDIRLNGAYDSTTSSDYHYVAGIVGHLGDSANVISGYSVTSIINNTMFASVDMGFGSGSTSGVSKNNSVKADWSYALTTADRVGVGESSSSVRGGGGLDTSGGVFARTDNHEQSYYRVKPTTTQNEFFTTRYDAMFAINSGAYKTAPILITSGTTFAQRLLPSDEPSTGETSSGAGAGSTSTDRQYLYYLQISDIVLTERTRLYGTDTQVSEFFGSYNGGGNDLHLSGHFDISHISTTNCGLFGSVISTASQPSMILGVVMPDVMVYASLMSEVETFGLLAGKTSANTIICNCYVAGELNLNISGATKIGGLVGSSGGRFIGCATDIIANLDGSGAYKYGAIYGVATTPISNYTLIDVYSAGKIKSTGTQATVAGMIADNSASNLYAKNCYTMTEISSASTNVANVVYNLGEKAHNTAGIWYDPSNSLDSTRDASIVWETYDYSAKRGQNFVGSNYMVRTSADRNYGMPILKWINSSNLAKSTGTGSQNSPYLINTSAQFRWMVSTGTATKYYKLNSDIDYRFLSATRYTASAFSGNLDGDYHYVSNLTSTLFNSVGGSVTKLGFDNVEMTGIGAILATVVNEGATVSQIYVDATGSSAVIGSGAISNSLSSGVPFGVIGGLLVTATNCYSTAIDDTTYSELDHSIWAYNGQKYALRGFIRDSRTLVKPIGTLTLIVDDADPVKTLQAFDLQDLNNALFYVTHYAGQYKIEYKKSDGKLDLNGYALNMPSNVTEITGIKEISHGSLSEKSLFAISGTLTITDCGLASGSDAPIIRTTAQQNSNITIKNSKIVANRAGGLMYNTMNTRSTLNIQNSTLFADSENVDLVATSVSGNNGNVSISVSNITIYGKNLHSVVGTTSGANGQIEITVKNVTNSKLQNIVTTAGGKLTIKMLNGAITNPVIGTVNSSGTQVTTIDLGVGVSLDSTLTNLVTTCSGKLIIDVSTALTLPSGFTFVGSNTSGSETTINLNAVTTINKEIMTQNNGRLSLNINQPLSMANSVDCLIRNNNGTVGIFAGGGASGLDLSGRSDFVFVLNNNTGGTVNINITENHTTKIANAMIHNNQGVATIYVIGTLELASNTDTLVDQNSGTVAIQVYQNGTLTTTGLSDFVFVSQSSGIVQLDIQKDTSLSCTRYRGVIGTYANTNQTAKGVSITLQANLTITATIVDDEIVAACAGGSVTFDEHTNLTFAPNTYQYTINGVAYAVPALPEPTPPTP